MSGGFRNDHSAKAPPRAALDLIPLPVTAMPLSVALLVIYAGSLELAPGDITFVLILEQHVSYRVRAPQTALNALAPVLDRTLLIVRPKA